ncbi:V-type H(+)-translocating pyrophosphatase VP1 [Toxoplasma gondii GAB2-2007-GAL-DOM2]|uniref:H(+)-exporting diphosphatase n=2 Tax=Toxoplasma gondii TaxID=5811 RepID=A0A086LBX7_TOXGO|nr:V-type H(+)-translocating pyrophosphatase VP1 [Toxoplasma gondii GAB2-2007-GAL-DOM2]KFG54145.1 V-type H(+)-translocating pyrophosphatase VP1 [Toxoplasma gondii FOU]
MGGRRRSFFLSTAGALAPAVATTTVSLIVLSSSFPLLSSSSPESEGDRFQVTAATRDVPEETSVAASRELSEEDATLRIDKATTCLLLLPSIIGLFWAVYEAWKVSKIQMDGPLGDDNKRLTDPLYLEMSGNIQQQLNMMKSISRCIADGAVTFLTQEFKYMAVYIVVFSSILGIFVGIPTMAAFVLGALTSILCGFVGMKIAVYSNVRTCHEAWMELGRGFQVALTAGSVMGFALVSLGCLTLVAIILLYRLPSLFGTNPEDQRALFEAVAGYGLGGSSIALFARVGGGIYTKAADVGADLSGKNEYGMSEDDPRNPACIADNVGDNVGDVAGMGADLFGSLAEASCAGLVIAGASIATSASGGPQGLAHSWSGLMFPVLISSTGIFTGIFTVVLVRACFSVRCYDDIEKALKWVMFISTGLEMPVLILLSYFFLPSEFLLDGCQGTTAWWHAAVCVVLGLWAGLAIGYVTEYYTSHSYFPVREISQTQIVSAATGIIYGLALGYSSTVVPIICLGVTILVSHTLCGMYGIALAALGMLSTLTMGLMIDGYGPISDNAGGIAEMAGLGPEVRSRTDALDAAGNTTAAVGKGYAIGSAALVSLALFGAFTVRAHITAVDVLDPWTFTGLLFGAMMPYAFSAMTMKSVGIAASDMVQECLQQFPLIIQGNIEPQYKRCIEISTRASLHEMIAPGALVICAPVAAGMMFGKNCTAGLLAGALVSGIQLAISASTSGSAWDNAKKYIESGALGADHGKGSQAHKNAVTGDTVGDPLKDTSGPSLNILIKLSAIISLVFGAFIAEHFSNAQGGPAWVRVL